VLEECEWSARSEEVEGGCEQELGEECEGASRKWAGMWEWKQEVG